MVFEVISNIFFTDVHGGPDRYIGYLSQTCRQIEDLHKCILVHRDIKGDNIFISGNRAQISDFGTLYDLPTKGTVYKVTGTPGYMPPELSQPARIQHSDEVKKSADVFALCATSLILFLRDQKEIISAFSAYVDEQENDKVNPNNVLAKSKILYEKIQNYVNGCGHTQNSKCATAKMTLNCINPDPIKRTKLSDLCTQLEGLQPKKL